MGISRHLPLYPFDGIPGISVKFGRMGKSTSNAQSWWRKPLVASSLTGLLLVLAWPPVGWTPLLFVAFVPLLSALQQASRAKNAFVWSYLAFFIWFAGTMYWIGNVVLRVEDQFVLSLAFVIAPLLMALPVWACVKLLKPQTNPRRFYWLPVFWVAYELIHSHWDLAFTWLHLGFGLSPAPALMTLYPITGPLGGTALILLANVLIFRMLLHSNARKTSGIVLGSLVILLVVAGCLRPSEPEGKATIAIVQANIDPYKKLDKSSLYDQVQTFKAVAGPGKAQKPELIVGSEGLLRSRPEAPLIVNRLAENPAIKDLQTFAADMNAPLLLGFIGVHFDLDEPGWTTEQLINAPDQTFSIYNGAVFITPNGHIDYSTKQQLVPFMEKVPFLEVLPFLERFRFTVNQATGSYTADQRRVVFEYENLRVAPLICLDGVFAHHAANLVQEGANLVAVISNDGWAGNTSGYLQNAAYSKAIAASVSRPVVRSANTGKSLVANAQGSELAGTGWDEQLLLIERVELQQATTIYQRLGDWLGWLALALSVLVPAILRWRSGTKSS